MLNSPKFLFVDLIELTATLLFYKWLLVLKYTSYIPCHFFNNSITACPISGQHSSEPHQFGWVRARGGRWRQRWLWEICPLVYKAMGGCHCEREDYRPHGMMGQTPRSMLSSGCAAATGLGDWDGSLAAKSCPSTVLSC